MMLPIASLRTDGGTQPRASIDRGLIDDYGHDMQNGIIFPPVTVFYDGQDYWLADGFHRIGAVEWIGGKDIECEVHQGTREDAQWFSFGANREHGLRRTNEDKQRAVLAAMEHPNSAGKSDRAIALHCGVTHMMVSRWRDKVSGTLCQVARLVTVNRAGKTYQVDSSKMGRRREVAAMTGDAGSDELAPAPVPVERAIPTLTNKEVWAAQTTAKFTKELLRLVRAYEKTHPAIESIVIARKNGAAVVAEIVTAKEAQVCS